MKNKFIVIFQNPDTDDPDNQIIAGPFDSQKDAEEDIKKALKLECYASRDMFEIWKLDKSFVDSFK